MSKTTARRVAANRPSSTASKDQIAEGLRRCDEYLRDVRGLSEGARSDRLRVVERLLRQKSAARLLDIARLRPAEVRRFLARQLDAHPSRSNASVLATALRSYLRYRSTCGDSVGALSAVISAPVHWRLASLPRALRPDALDHLLNAFTPECRWPKRGYAIVLCAVDMELRCGEIAKLMISNIDWRSGTATLRSTKSLRQLRRFLVEARLGAAFPQGCINTGSSVDAVKRARWVPQDIIPSVRARASRRQLGLRAMAQASRPASALSISAETSRRSPGSWPQGLLDGRIPTAASTRTAASM